MALSARSAAQGGSDLVGLIAERLAARSRAACRGARLAALPRAARPARGDAGEPARHAVARIDFERMLRRAARRTRRRLRGVTALVERRAAARAADRLEARALRGRAGRPGRGPPRPAGLAKRAEALQTILGEHQDAVVAEQRLQGLAADATPAAAFVAGRLAERQRDSPEGRACRSCPPRRSASPRPRPVSSRSPDRHRIVTLAARGR